ncbi:MAG: sodium-translocating pyrophosphatase [Armatimonadetes bacterium]|nr:sodium-translocating pyrophosphatase [Armatimonadota bacterium]
MPGLAFAAETDVKLPPFKPEDWTLVFIVLASSFVALAYGWYLARKTTRHDPGSQAMQDVSAAIQQGAMVYLGQQVKTMVWFVAAIALGLFFFYRGAPGMTPVLAAGISLAFLMGVAASYGAGYVGMGLAVRANTRVASAALRSFKSALEIAFQAGTVSGMFTTGLGLLGATIILIVFKEDTMKVLIGFGFGGCLAALFMRIGGGIFTKAADVGADLVGKVEAGIPEDDPRNAATIADNVGDNVGDCAGMAADVFESYEVTLVAAIILGVFAANTEVGRMYGNKLVIYPLLVRAIGVFASIIGTWFVRGRDDEAMDPMQPINVGFWTSAMVASIGFGIVAMMYLQNWRFFAATFMGIILVLIIGRLTEYFTSTEKPPVTEIANATRTGTATMLLMGLAEGMESSVWAIVAIAATIFTSFALFGDITMAFYGISLAGLGLLTTTAYLLAMDTFGPITDNANGIFEMSGALKGDGGETNEGAHRIVARLDAVGNTTKALTKGFAIATAVIAATSLFGSFVQDAGLHEGIRVDLPPVFVGLLIGGAVPFLFSSFAIRAVSRAAGLLVNEVRRQFREIPGIMEGTGKPDYGRCVAISTAAAQKELIGPGLLAIATPLLVGFGLGYNDPKAGAAALGGYLAGAILTGQLMAVFQANTGGAWDNAKKKIEDGMLGGKGTEFHKSAVIGDTVGDPLKDTAGPALNPLIKVMNLVAILAIPAVALADLSTLTRTVVVLVCLGCLVAAVAFSKREGEHELGADAEETVDTAA